MGYSFLAHELYEGLITSLRNYNVLDRNEKLKVRDHLLEASALLPSSHSH